LRHREHNLTAIAADRSAALAFRNSGVDGKAVAAIAAGGSAAATASPWHYPPA